MRIKVLPVLLALLVSGCMEKDPTGPTGGTTTPTAGVMISSLSISNYDCPSGASRICVLTVVLKTVNNKGTPFGPIAIDLKATGGSVPGQVTTAAKTGLASFTWSFGAVAGSFRLTACVAKTKTCTPLDKDITK